MVDDLNRDAERRARAAVLAALAPHLEMAGRGDAEIPDDANLLLSGILDSFAFLQLVMTVEERLGVTADFAGRGPEEFATPGGLVRILAARLSAPAAEPAAAPAAAPLTAGMLEAALAEVGVGRGDHVIVHSSLETLGWPEDGGGAGAAMHLDVLRRVLGPQGTIAVPTFTFGFCRDGVYDAAGTPSADMGVFAEEVRRRPEARRTRHPIQSMAALGRHADALAGPETDSAYGPGSAWDRLPDLGFKLLLLGAGAYWASFIHQCEERVGVPYRAWKSFTGEVAFEPGRSERRTFRMYVRPLHIDPDVRAERVRDRLLAEGLWRETRLNHGPVAACRLTDYRAAAEAMLRADPYALLANAAEVAAALAREPA